MVFEQIMQILILATVVLVFWWSHRSFPPQATAELIQQLSEASQTTQTRLDDVLVEIAKLLNDQRMNDESQSERKE